MERYEAVMLRVVPPEGGSSTAEGKLLKWESEGAALLRVIDNHRGIYPFRPVPRSTWFSNENQDFRVPGLTVKSVAPIVRGCYSLRSDNS